MTVDPATLSIVSYPAPVLRVKAEPVEAVDDEIRGVIRRMIDLMDEAEGVGLAAPQVGLSWRLFVSRLPEEGAAATAFINPELELHPGDLVSHEEGCLSLPGITAQVRRPDAVTIKALGLDGKPIERVAAGFEARVWQHEYDHLDGILIIDRMSPMDRIANRRPLKALEG